MSDVSSYGRSPQVLRREAYGYLLGASRRELTGMATADLAGAVVAAVSAAGSQVAKSLQVLARTLESRAADPGDLTAVHRRIGERAQASVLASYDQTVTRRAGGGERYRVGSPSRLAGGVLRRALQRSDLFLANPQGIRWLNTEMLDREAAHWYRLNFGAAPAGTGSSRTFELTWGGMVIAALGYDAPPSGGFAIPRGTWIGGAFYPAGEYRTAAYRSAFAAAGGDVRRQSYRVTRGIAARNFLDAGLRTIVTQLPDEYDALYRRWVSEASSGIGPLAGTKTVQFRAARRSVSTLGG